MGSLLKSNRDRIHQIVRWLRHNYPTSVKTSVRIVDRVAVDRNSKAGKVERRTGDWAVIYELGDGSLEIQISKSAHRARTEMIETLLHEWAHAMVHPKVSGHSDSWGRAYARVYRHFFDRKGCYESRDF